MPCRRQFKRESNRLSGIWIVNAFSPTHHRVLAAKCSAAPGRRSFRSLAQRAALCGLMLSAALRVSADSWEKLPSLPAANGGFISGEAQGKILVIGGTNWTDETKHWLNTVHRFDPATLAWTSLGSLPSPLAYGVGGKLDGAFTVIGGTTGTTPWHGVVRIDGDQVDVTHQNGVSSPTVLSAGGVIDGEIILVGGTDDAANVRGLHREVRAFNLKTGRTRTLPEFPGRGIGTAAAAVASGELLVFAGSNFDSSTGGVQNMAESWAFSPERGAWRSLEPYPLAARGVAAVALDARRIYLAGGYLVDDFTDRAYVFDTVTGAYTPARALPYKGMVGLVRCGEFVYCLGGEDRPKHRTDAVLRAKIADLAE